MPLVTLSTRIKAPIERVFDLSRSIDLHLKQVGETDEITVGGRTGGLLENGDEVTWEQSHFALRQPLRLKITVLNRPQDFTHEMLEGPFARMKHLHRFQEDSGGVVLMDDELDYKSRCGPLGWFLENSFLTAYLRRYLAERNKVIKRVAESKEWREYLPDDPLQD